MKLNLFNESNAKIPQAKIKKLFNNIMTEAMDTKARGAITDKQIQAFNKQFRTINRPTDVLSFNYDNPDEDENLFGEIYISFETTSRQAKQNKVTLESEFLKLTCHGLLHLLGYDHQKQKDFDLMNELEQYYLEDI